ncbi:methyltransferase domain-containing protein [Nibribacter ruber]|uniref:Methyltransferase domain-containing protein n=1 Tax=Nibribacter ruber TaxID=2698458 RepID=A0A6P1NT10_9BACT|nr:methyltransferase [Nibribacter ruber]QHL86170.1 methyltransferase domain-containing protein [Nibribacter ruber]
MHETPELNAGYWSSRYQQKETGWDAGFITAPLETYINQLENKDLSILIPGCGHGHEAEFLHRQGFPQVYLMDFAPEPLERFKSRNPNFPADHLLQQDFFQHTALTFDLILEQTFFCALPRNRRPDYARKMFDLLKPGGKLVGVLFSEEFSTPGPPYGGTPQEYQAYFEPYFTFKVFEPCYNSIPPRAGREWFMVLERRPKPQFIA